MPTIIATTKVPSSTGSGSYTITDYSDGSRTCTCKSFEKIKPNPCKHIKAAKAVVKPTVASKAKAAPKAASAPTPAPAAPRQPAASGSGLAGLFSGKVGAPTVNGASKSKSKKVKPVEEVPTELKAHTEVMVAGKMIAKAVEKKVAAATDAVKSWSMSRFAEIWSMTGTRPATFEVHGGIATFDFIQTKRIFLTPERVQAVRDLGVNIDEWTDIKGVNINYEAIKRHGLEEKLQEALGSMGLSDAVLGEILQPKHELKEGFFDAMFSVCNDALAEGESIKDKIYSVMLALLPVNQVKNPKLDLQAADEDAALTAALELIVHSAVAAESADVEERDDE